MDITIYLPDDLGKRAKDHDVNLSRMLRDALTQRFQEDDAMAATLEGAKQVELSLENDDGVSYLGRITGTMIASSDHVVVYLTDKENVVVYDVDKLKYYIEDWQTSLEDLIGDQEVYLEAMSALGREATIDLGI